jgi:trimeric autotransporter adhesin
MRPASISRESRAGRAQAARRHETTAAAPTCQRVHGGPLDVSAAEWACAVRRRGASKVCYHAVRRHRARGERGARAAAAHACPALSRAPTSMLARRVLLFRRALLSQAIRPLRTCTPMADAAAAAAGAEPAGAALDGADGAAPVLGPDGQPISTSALKKLAKLKELEAKKAASAAAAAARATTAAKTPTAEESAAAAKKVSSTPHAAPPPGVPQSRPSGGTAGWVAERAQRAAWRRRRPLRDRSRKSTQQGGAGSAARARSTHSTSRHAAWLLAPRSVAGAARARVCLCGTSSLYVCSRSSSASLTAVVAAAAAAAATRTHPPPRPCRRRRRRSRSWTTSTRRPRARRRVRV